MWFIVRYKVARKCWDIYRHERDQSEHRTLWEREREKRWRWINTEYPDYILLSVWNIWHIHQRTPADSRYDDDLFFYTHIQKHSVFIYRHRWLKSNFKKKKTSCGHWSRHSDQWIENTVLQCQRRFVENHRRRTHRSTTQQRSSLGRNSSRVSGGTF